MLNELNLQALLWTGAGADSIRKFHLPFSHAGSGVCHDQQVQRGLPWCPLLRWQRVSSSYTRAFLAVRNQHFDCGFGTESCMINLALLMESFYTGRFIDMAETLCQKRALAAFRLDPEKWGGQWFLLLLKQTLL